MISLVFLSLVYRFGSYGTEQIPVMNEICTANFSVAADAGGSYLDFLELYNPYDADYVMDDLWLSDDKDEPQQFDMTGIVVPSHGYTVIWMMDEEDLPEVAEDLEEAMSTDVVDLFDTPTTLDCPQYYCTFDVSRKGGYLYISNSIAKYWNPLRYRRSPTTSRTGGLQTVAWSSPAWSRRRAQPMTALQRS